MEPYMYDYSDIFGAATGGMVAFLVIFYAMMFVFGIAMYVMEGIATLRMAKKTGVPNGWMGFIPVANVYLLGRIADAGTGNRKHAKRLLVSYIALYASLIPFFVTYVMVIFSAVAGAEMPVVPLIIMLIVLLAMIAIAVCCSVFCYIAYYHICKNFGGDSGTGYFVGILVGTFVCPIVSVILMLILSGKNPAMVENGTVTVTPPPSVPHTDDVFH
ncbi:MAG: hypothetical protein IJX64_01400 [Clostridia bacterium]|nr:hypothetical protein [Clostridia bacterium]